MRRIRRSLLGSSFLLLLCVSVAEAGPTVSLVWRASGASSLASTDAPDSCYHCTGDDYILDVVLEADETEVLGVFISFLFDSDGANELDFVHGAELSSVKLSGRSSFRPLLPGVVLVQESEPGVTGIIGDFDTATLQFGLISGTATLGSLIFSPNAFLADGIDIVPIVRPNGVDAIIDGGGFVIDGQTTFLGASVPEPTTGLLLVLGLAGLGMAGRRAAS